MVEAGQKASNGFENEQRGTYEEFAEDGGETREAKTEEPGAEGIDGERGVVFERDQTEGVVLLCLNRTLLSGGVEVDSTDVFGHLASSLGLNVE